MRTLLFAGVMVVVSWILLTRQSGISPPDDPEVWLRDPRGTEIAWEHSAVAEPRRIPQRDFVLGHLHWQRADQASVMLAEPEPPVAAYAQPIREVEAAWRSWTAAADAERPWRRLQGETSIEWMPARRNAQRAWDRLQELKAAEEQARERQEQPPPDSGAGTEGGEPGEETTVAAVDRVLTAEELRGLRDRLLEQQEAKRAARLADRPNHPGGDW